MFREKDIQQNTNKITSSAEIFSDEDFDVVLDFLTLLIEQDLKLKGDKND